MVTIFRAVLTNADALDVAGRDREEEQGLFIPIRFFEVPELCRYRAHRRELVISVVRVNRNQPKELPCESGCDGERKRIANGLARNFRGKDTPRNDGP